jgi:AcrR family transcriptional regulator
MARKTTARAAPADKAVGDKPGRRNGTGIRRRRDQEVVDTAAQIFFERGYTEASVQDIADALGMLKGSLYYYIDTKEDLLFRVLEQVHDEVDAIMQDAIAREGLSSLERLGVYVRLLVVHITANLPRMSVYYHDIDRLGSERHEIVIRRRRAHQDFVTRLIEEAQAAGEADPNADARLTGDFVFGAVIWSYRWYKPRGRYRREAIADACAEFILNGVTGRPPTAG